MIAPLHALALAPDGGAAALDALTLDELALLVFSAELSLRPEQVLPRDHWRSFGFLSGRGWGKTHGIAAELHRRVAAGEVRAPALMAPTDDRIADVQVAALVATAPAWCRCEPYRRGVRWANGVVTQNATAEVERPSSGSNFDFAWLTEIVRWNPSTRISAFNDITTATRLGARPQYVWDTTSSGKNDVILTLLAQHEASPREHRVVRGTMFDNPILDERYVRDEIKKYTPGTRAYDEEIQGLVFAESAGALWRQEWISPHRATVPPATWDNVVLGLDPALSGDTTADEVGLAKAYRAGDQIWLDDLSEKMSPEDYATAVVRECQRDASGVVVERNHVGQHARDLIKVHARLAGMRVELLPDPAKAFPPRRRGVIHVREIVSHAPKETRATPAAALYARGLVHHIGVLARLEHEQTTWEPGTKRSPNRLDAAVFAVSELGGVAQPQRKGSVRDVADATKLAESLRFRAGGGRGRLGL